MAITILRRTAFLWASRSSSSLDSGSGKAAAGGGTICRRSCCFFISRFRVSRFIVFFSSIRVLLTPPPDACPSDAAKAFFRRPEPAEFILSIQHFIPERIIFLTGFVSDYGTIRRRPASSIFTSSSPFIRQISSTRLRFWYSLKQIPYRVSPS